VRISIAAIGKVRDKHAAALVDEYVKRLHRYAKLQVIEVKEVKHAGSIEETRRRESEALLRAASPRGITVALDERGAHWRSVELADRLDRAAVSGDGDWTFFVGGAEGHDASLRDSCDFVWSLSALTLPHELCRVVLVEQLYRAMTIRAGEQYHREG
jgi:23S rRNA (pseudouridine1915-N3)-methyltransferase